VPDFLTRRRVRRAALETLTVAVCVALGWAMAQL
jgi:hypothetical protein